MPRITGTVVLQFFIDLSPSCFDAYQERWRPFRVAKNAWAQSLLVKLFLILAPSSWPLSPLRSLAFGTASLLPAPVNSPAHTHLIVLRDSVLS